MLITDQSSTERRNVGQLGRDEGENTSSQPLKIPKSGGEPHAEQHRKNN